MTNIDTATNKRLFITLPFVKFKIGFYSTATHPAFQQKTTLDKNRLQINPPIALNNMFNVLPAPGTSENRDNANIVTFHDVAHKT